MRKNLERNGVQDGALEEVDWLVEGAASRPKAAASRGDVGQPAGTVDDKVDVIVAADCIYNPSLSAPLAKTIDKLAGPGTVVLVASELRDEEPLEIFLREWFDLGWVIVRPELGEGGLGGREFVVWVGWRAEEGAATGD